MTAPRPTVPRTFANVAVLVVCGFLFGRTACLEPFGVPTGSMALALAGNHREGFCPRCDFRVLVGEPRPDDRPVRFADCRCPNCGEKIDLTDARELQGDRLLVDKTVFHARSPRRWEVAVFRCPADLSKPYVKRVVGLPGEFIQVSGGDVYADGQLLRKTLAQVRETRVVVFDPAHAPAGGWAARWLVQPVGGTASSPADDTVVRPDGLHLAGGVGLTYRHWNLDAGREEAVPDYLAYNGPPADRRAFARGGASVLGDPVHDFAVAFTLEVPAGAGRFACRLSDGADSVRADFPIGSPLPDLPGVTLAADNRPLASVTGLVLAAGKRYRVEFAFVDRRASLSIDGVELPPLDLPADPPDRPRRGGMARPVQFGVGGTAVVIADLILYRDIHYLNGRKSSSGWRPAADEYFVLGDNAANSHDSREWEIGGNPAPGVPERDFLGKPFLLHQPLRLARVPGTTRTVVGPDWARLRWVR